MTTFAQLRKAALALPETAEQGSRAPGAAAFSVRGRRFATLDRDDRVLLHLPEAEADEVVATYAGAERLPYGVAVPIAGINGQQLNHWVRRAWHARAPKRLTEAAAAADHAVPGEVGDLPRSIGAPATRALRQAGITTLAQIAQRSDADLLALHGVGPKAVRLLREACG
ncbi:hypothetical protein ACFS2C_13220 [Prauserella oleivorans]|uniref:Helix-hairpin-helix protein n=1 Tax=Prauserella oleivorans TaxID=1478153 RepID=A0ABW5W970_9PSEU